MKKNIFFIFLAVLFGACSGAIENDAKKQMEITMKELAKDPSSVKISDVQTKFSNDSICILHFKLSAINGFGIRRATRYEYIYIIRDYHSKKETRKESIIDLEDKSKKSVLEEAHNNYVARWLESDSISSLKDEDRKTWHINLAVSIQMIVAGRTVGEDKYDVNNW